MSLLRVMLVTSRHATRYKVALYQVQRHQSEFMEFGNPFYSPISVHRLFCNPLNSDTLKPFRKVLQNRHNSYLDFLLYSSPLSQSKHNPKNFGQSTRVDPCQFFRIYISCVSPLTRVSVLRMNFVKRIFVRSNGFVIVWHCKGTTFFLISKLFYEDFCIFLPFGQFFYLFINFVVFFLPFYQKSDKMTIIYPVFPIYLYI